jgi:hypothetical protein
MRPTASRGFVGRGGAKDRINKLVNSQVCWIPTTARHSGRGVRLGVPSVGGGGGAPTRWPAAYGVSGPTNAGGRAVQQSGEKQLSGSCRIQQTTGLMGKNSGSHSVGMQKNACVGRWETLAKTVELAALHFFFK